MEHRDVQAALGTFTVIVDSREQMTKKLIDRLNSMGCPHVRRALRYGDYSAMVRLSGGGTMSLESAVCVERKMNFSELCSCFGKGRDRFTREFERAKEDGAKLYLLIECASWEKAYKGDYRSRMKPQALIASMTAWMARYGCQIIMCQPAVSGKLIKELLYREMKEKLTAMEELP